MARNLGNLHTRTHLALPIIPVPSIWVAHGRLSPKEFEVFALQMSMAQSMRCNTSLSFCHAELIHDVVIPGPPALQ